jgi:hypothetical protein
MFRAEGERVKWESPLSSRLPRVRPCSVPPARDMSQTQTAPWGQCLVIVDARHDSHHLRLPFPAANGHHLETFLSKTRPYLAAGSITHVVGACFFLLYPLLELYPPAACAPEDCPFD